MPLKRTRGHGAFINELLTDTKLGPSGIPEPRIFHWWIYKVPRRISQHAWPARYFKGTLTVHTRTAAWASDLHYMRDDLLASAKLHLPAQLVRDIKFRQGQPPDGAFYSLADE
ncbi:MAG: DUF721 domain-containing protein [Myxococcales bacterium]|nr:DUF721 domain-containing protein [Myxococcales bacterium]